MPGRESGIAIAQFLIASLAFIQIGSEYGTRMITTTLTAVPRKITAMLAKTVVIAATSFVVGVVAAFVSFLVAQPLLEPHGLAFGLTADGELPSIVSTAAYLALIAILGPGIGALLRNSAGGPCVCGVTASGRQHGTACDRLQLNSRRASMGEHCPRLSPN